MKRKIISLILAVLMLVAVVGCGSQDIDADAVTPTPEVEVTPTPTPTPTSTPIPTPTPMPDAEEDSDISLNDLIVIINAILNQAYGNTSDGHVEASVENNEIVISFWYNGVGDLLPAVMDLVSSETKTNWAEMKEGLIILDGSILELVEVSGYGNMPVTIKILNDATPEETFLVITNGEIVYDIFENIESPSANDDTQETISTQPETVTLGQKNALSSAKQYLAIMAFSRSGLIDQLEFEGYSTEEATYGADHCDADWNEQSAKAAKQYLDIMSFSRQGLIDQLKFDGFTAEQAEYGVAAVGY